MAKKIYIESNYLIVEDTISGAIDQTVKSHIEYRVNDSSVYWFFDTDLNRYMNDGAGYVDDDTIIASIPELSGFTKIVPPTPENT